MKQKLSKLPDEKKKEYVAKKRAKELERVLLPDAPPRRRPRKGSPKRVVCRLVPGTPPRPVPPPPKPQDWQQLKGSPKRVVCRLVPGTPPRPVPPPPKPQYWQQLERSEGASESKPSPLMCDWTTGELRPPSPIPVVAARTGRPRRKPSATVTSADVGSTLSPTGSHSSPPPSTSPLPSCSRTSQEQKIHEEDPDTQKEEAMVLAMLDQLSDEESIDVPDFETRAEPDINFAGEEPALLPEETDATIELWLTDQDMNADRTVTAMLSNDILTFDWSNNPDSFLGQREDFTGDSGPTFPVLDSTRPIDIFLKFFDDDIFNIIVSETNRHVECITQRPLQKHSRLHNFKETDKSEMAIFIAVLIFQGLCPLPVEKDYFRENGYLTLPYFKYLMTYNRFSILKRLLHFTDNVASTQDMTTDQKKLRKLGPLLDLLNNKFSRLYLPSRNIAIDESLLKWHGRLSFSQKIATKAAKVGVKSYELCETSTGYLWKFLIFTGKGMTHGQTDEIEQTDAPTDTQTDTPTDRQTDKDDGQIPTNITAQIVNDLVKPLLNRGHTLTMDNFYNSPLLARYLKCNKTDCLGTLRVNREFVPESIKGMAKSELRPGEIVNSYCRDLSILLWRDSKNAVSLISTFHKGDIGGKEKYGNYRYKPQAVLDYNLTMGGVDKKDQLLAAHPMERRRNQAWYKKVFRRLLNVTILNAYIIFKTRFPNIAHRQFRVQLANELVQHFKTPAIEVPRLTEIEIVRIIQMRKFKRPILRGNHFIGLGDSKNKRCFWCKNARSKYICKQCGVSLCLQKCFEHFHTQK